MSSTARQEAEMPAPNRLKIPGIPPSIRVRGMSVIAAVAFCLAATLGLPAGAQVMTPGDAVVTGFSGIKTSDQPVPPGGDPLDEFFIDPSGPSAQVMSLAAPGSAPSGQLVTA